MIGRHVIRTWSSTQPSVTLSSGEAEFYGPVKAAGASLGHQAIMEERMQQLISALTPRVTGSAPVTPVKNTSAAAAAAAGAAH